MDKNSILDVLAKLDKYDEVLIDLQEVFLANLVMLSEIPAPTFDEEKRVNFILDRFSEINLTNTSTDECGNALGILNGTGDTNILLSANLDTSIDAKTDHAVSVGPTTITGPAAGYNAVGLAALIVIPQLLEKLDIRLKSNLILIGSARSLGKGSIGGLRFFLSNTKHPIRAGILIDGIHLGEISHRSIGMIRCEVVYTVLENYQNSDEGRIGAIETISEIISRIRTIPIPGTPITSISFSSFESSSPYGTTAGEGILNFEIKSESEEMVKALKLQIQDIVAEVVSSYNADVVMNVIAQRRPGGITFTNPLIFSARNIMDTLDIKYIIKPNTAELSAFIDNSIPAIALGITNIIRKDKKTEQVEIEPLKKGLKALLSLIIAADDEEEQL